MGRHPQGYALWKDCKVRELLKQHLFKIEWQALPKEEKEMWSSRERKTQNSVRVDATESEPAPHVKTVPNPHPRARKENIEYAPSPAFKRAISKLEQQKRRALAPKKSPATKSERPAKTKDIGDAVQFEEPLFLGKTTVPISQKSKVVPRNLGGVKKPPPTKTAYGLWAQDYRRKARKGDCKHLDPTEMRYKWDNLGFEKAAKWESEAKEYNKKQGL